MHESRTPTAPAPRTFDPAAILRAAGEAYRNGDIRWGREDYIDPDGCRCAAGAISYATDPADLDGDPRWVADGEPAAMDAVYRLADYLHRTFPTLPPALTDDPIETVGAWNDAEGRTVGEVIAALEGAAA